MASTTIWFKLCLKATQEKKMKNQQEPQKEKKNELEAKQPGYKKILLKGYSEKPPVTPIKRKPTKQKKNLLCKTIKKWKDNIRKNEEEILKMRQKENFKKESFVDELLKEDKQKTKEEIKAEDLMPSAEDRLAKVEELLVDFAGTLKDLKQTMESKEKEKEKQIIKPEYNEEAITKALEELSSYYMSINDYETAKLLMTHIKE